MMDELTQAVLARDEVARYLSGGTPLEQDEARARVLEFIEELRTTQRSEWYRTIEATLYPILRKVQRVGVQTERAVAAHEAGRVIWVSNHRSHVDYLVEPLVMIDAGIPPPLMAAGINLFGGPLGLLHRHVTGAIPIRRNTKDPAYLMTLKAYVAEVLQRHDIFFYPEGGRSYSGELKAPKTGLYSACLSARIPGATIVPMAVSYDVVLEDHVLARQKVKRAQRAFSSELREMVRYAVGYQSRAIVHFGEPVPLAGVNPDHKKSIIELAEHVQQAIGRLYTVLPTTMLCAAMHPSTPAHELRDEIARLIDRLRAAGASMHTTDADQVLADATEPLEARGVIAVEDGVYRVRERNVLRYYARGIEHLLPDTAQTT
jgi:glycerol-3-phosphate O-acyltransferase